MFILTVSVFSGSKHLLFEQNTGGGALPYNRLMGMCCWMGSHFHDWIDYNGVAFSIELLEWGPKFSIFGVRKFFMHICG